MSEPGTWVTRARGALAGVPEAGDDIDIVPARPPPVLDATGARAIVTPLLAVFAWLATVLQRQIAANPLDPWSLLLRLVALALTVQAILHGLTLGRRIRSWLQLRRYGLALAPEGLLFRGPDGEWAVARDDVIDIRERGDWRKRGGGRRWSEVFILVRPGSQPDPARPPYVALPPVFDRTPGVLAERLMRWRGPPAEDEDDEASGPPAPDPNRSASRIYDQAAAGHPPEGGIVVRHGRAWLKRGPYATLLLAVAIAAGALRLPTSTWTALNPAYPAGLMLCLAVVPVFWIGLTRRHVAPRKGIALVFTPAELLMRTRAGVLSVQWRKLARVAIDGRATWSILEGYHVTRALVIERTDAPVIRYDEAFLGVPAEVAQGFAEAYKSGKAV